MVVGQYHQIRQYISCDAIGCRQWQHLPLEPLPVRRPRGNEERRSPGGDDNSPRRSSCTWFNDKVGMHGAEHMGCCLCPEHHKELERMVEREIKSELLSRHHIYIYIYILYIYYIYTYAICDACCPTFLMCPCAFLARKALRCCVMILSGMAVTSAHIAKRWRRMHYRPALARMN